MKRCLFVVVFLCLIGSVSAAAYSESVFNGWVYAGNASNTSTGESFEVISHYGNTIDIKFEKLGEFLIDEGDCAEQNNLVICFKESAFSHYNYSLPGRKVYKLLLEMDAVIAKIELGRAIEREELLIGQKSAIKTALSNPSNRNTEVVFSDSFNDSVSIFVEPGCVKKENNVTWQGTLSAGQEKICTYTLTGLKGSSFSSVAFAEYNNGVKKVKVQDSKTIKVAEQSFKTDIKLSKNTGFKEEFVVNVSLWALKDLHTEYKLAIPPAIKVLGWERIDGLDREENLFTYSKDMKSGEEYNFTLRIMPESIGLQVIKEKGEFVVGDYRQEFEKENTVNITHKPPHVALARTNFSSGKNVIDIFISNPSDFSFYSAELTIRSKLPLNKTAWSFRELKPKSHEEVTQEFEAEPGNYDFNTELAYDSESNQRLFSAQSSRVVIEQVKAEAEKVNETKEEKEGNVSVAEKKEEVAVKEEFKERKSAKFIVSAAIVAAVLLIASTVWFIRRKRQII